MVKQTETIQQKILNNKKNAVKKNNLIDDFLLLLAVNTTSRGYLPFRFFFIELKNHIKELFNFK